MFGSSRRPFRGRMTPKGDIAWPPSPRPQPRNPDRSRARPCRPQDRQQAAWSSGNYAIVGATLQIVGEELCEAIDLKAGSKVLDVAAGNGMASLAAARRWCDVTSTDYVPALLERGQARAAAEGMADRIPARRTRKTCRSPTTASTMVLSTFGVMFTPNQDTAAGRADARLQAEGPDRPRQLDAGRLHRPGVQDARQTSAAAGRRQIAGAVGHARAAHGNVRRRRRLDQGGIAPVQFPLPLADRISSTCSRPITARC